MSPKWTIQRYRLLEAAEQLKAANPPELAALAASLGYADHAHFAPEFKETIGRSPPAFLRTDARGDGVLDSAGATASVGSGSGNALQWHIAVPPRAALPVRTS